MKNIFFLVYIICLFLSSKSQSNQVLNSGFENSADTCLPGMGLGCFGRNKVSYWNDPNLGSSDYFSPYANIAPDYTTCGLSTGFTTPPLTVFGYEYPRNGYCYGGFAFLDVDTSNFHEYIQGTLRNPLIMGRTYAIECYVSLGDIFPSCLSNLGFYFSDTLVNSRPYGERMDFVPQFENPDLNMIDTKVGWQRIRGNYNAHGGERYLNIGNFRANNSSNIGCYDSIIGQASYLFIDDVAVYDTSGIDTIHLCSYDSVLIGGIWRKNEGIYTEMIGGLPVKFFVSPRSYSINLTIVEKPFAFGDSIRLSLLQMGGIDSGVGGVDNYIWIKSDTSFDFPMYNIYGCDSTIRYQFGWRIGIEKGQENKTVWSIYPNPANDFLHITLNKNDIISYSISIIDITGKQVISQSISNTPIDISLLRSGMYFVKLLNSKTGKLIGTEKFVKE
jgi:hypothetical protein